MGQHADARSDVYSMGVMLYRALCGKLPYAATNPAALAYMHVHEPYPSMGERAPGVDVSSRLESICMRCMKKDPAERFSDAGAFLEKLRATSRFVLGPDVLPPPDKSASRVAAVALKVPELPVPPEQDLTPRIDTEETDFPEDTDITDAMGPPPPLPPRDEAPPPVPVPVHDLGEPGLVDSGSSSRMLRIMLSAAAVVVLFCGGLGAGLQLFFAEGVAAFEDGLLQALEREEAQAVLPVEPHGPAPVLTDVVQTEELPEVEAAVEVAQQPEPPDSEPVAIAPEPAPGLPPRDGARQAALDSIREVLDEPAVQPPPVEESVVDAVAAIEPTRAEVEPSAGGGSDLGLSIVGASGHEESPQPLVIPPPEPPGVVIQPSSGDLPPPAPQRGTVTADEVSFTADEAAATLNWINTASEKELKASGIYSLGVTNILTQRPYQSIEVFAATHYVGPKSVQAAKYAALR